jgi:hypothetical protein
MLTPKDYIFGVVVAVLLLLCGGLYFVNTSLDAKVKKYETEKAENAGAAKQSAHEANATTVRIQEKIVYREKQSAPIYKYIETYKGDTNASDCDNNMSLLRSFSF